MEMCRLKMVMMVFLVESGYFNLISAVGVDAVT